MKRDYGGIGEQVVTVQDDDRTVDVITVTPCCGAKYHSIYGHTLPTLDGRPVCLVCGHTFVPGAIKQERDLSHVVKGRVSRYVS